MIEDKNEFIRDFQQPTRMGWEALIVLTITTIWSFFQATWFVLVAIIFGSFRSFSWYIMILLFAGLFILTLVNVLIKYFTTKLHITDGKVICTTGLFNQREQSIPLSRIHALRTKEGFLYQMVDMVGIVFDTISIEQGEIEFILSQENWKTLSSLVEVESKVTAKEEVVESEIRERPIAHYRLGLKGLLLSALTQNHFRGLLIIGVVFAAIYNSVPDQEWLLREVFDSAEGLVIGVSVLSILITLLAIYLTSVFLWICKILLQYWGLRVEFYDQHLIFQAGLLNKIMVKIPRDKVIGIEQKRNILEEKFGLTTITILQAKIVEGVKEKNRIKMFGIPFGEELITWWVGHDLSSENTNYESRSGIVLFWRSLSIKWVPILAIYSLYSGLYFPWGLFLHIILVPIAIWESWMRFKKSRIELYDNYLLVQHGRFADRQTIIPYDNVEHLQAQRIHLGKWQSRRKKLTIATKSDPYVIRSLPRSEATNIYDYLLFRSSLDFQHTHVG